MSVGGTRPGASRLFGAVLLVLAAWSAAVPYVARPLGLAVATRPVVEVVDHVVPGAVLAAVAVAALVRDRLRLEAALVAVLAGLWMTATHVPLLVQARSGVAAWDAALFHSVPGAVVLAVTAAAAVRAWREAGP